MSNTEPVIPETKHVHTCVEPMQVLSNQIEQLQTQLAGCLTAAEGWAGTDWNRESYGWSPAFQATIELHERMTKAEADLAAARENASQNAGNYLACEKRFEEAIAQRDAANLRAEGLEKRQEHTQDWYAEHYGKLQDWARAILPEPWRTQFFSCIANGLYDATKDIGKPYRAVAGFMVTPGGYFRLDTAQEQILHDQCTRAETAEAENAALTTRLEGLIRDNQASAAEVVELRARVEQSGRPVRKPKGTVVYENPDGSGDRMDLECVQICDAMNTLPGIETISSCCGHVLQPFRIYFVAEYLNDLKPIMELIDESEIWRMRCSMATGNMEIYFILETANGWLDAYAQADELAKLIRARSERSSQ